MTRAIRFGDFLREASIQQQEVSYKELVPPIVYDEQGNELPWHPPKLSLRSIDIYRLIVPYTRVRLMEQIKAVLPPCKVAGDGNNRRFRPKRRDVARLQWYNTLPVERAARSHTN